MQRAHHSRDCALDEVGVDAPPLPDSPLGRPMLSESNPGWLDIASSMIFCSYNVKGAKSLIGERAAAEVGGERRV